MRIISKRYRWYHVTGADDWQIFGSGTLNFDDSTSAKDLSVSIKNVGKKHAYIRFFEFLSRVEEDSRVDEDSCALRWAFMADKRASPKRKETHIYFLLGGIEQRSDIRRQLRKIWRDFGFELELVDFEKAAKEKSFEYRRLLRTIKKNVCFCLLDRLMARGRRGSIDPRKTNHG